MMKPTEYFILNPFQLVFLVLLIVGTHVAYEDFTQAWYFGCRWLGGSSVSLICNCTNEAEEMYIQRGSITSPDIGLIELNNCPKIRFGTDSISSLNNLRHVRIKNCASLTLEPNSLTWYGYRDANPNQEERFDVGVPSLRVSIKNTRGLSIGSQAFSGRINEILFDSVEVDKIDAFAFSNLLQMENLIFRDVVLKNVLPQAFKKFGTEFLTLDSVNAGYLPSRTFSDITVYRTLTIKDSKFETVRPSTFIIHNPSLFTVSNTQIEQLEGEAFWINTNGDAIFKNNVFKTVQGGAFNGIQTSGTGRMITFESNTFTTLETRSLKVQPGFQARVVNLNLNQTCDCNDIVNNLRDASFYNEIFCLDSENQYVSVREYKVGSCSIFTGYYTMIISICVVILVMAIVAVSFYMYYRLVYLSQRYGCEKNGKAPMSLIVPDGRTYKETELHVVVERADLLTTDL